MVSTVIHAEERAGYGAVARAIHWLTLALIVIAFTLAWTLDYFDQPLKGNLIDLHRWVGVLVFALVPIRLLTRWVMGVPRLPNGTPAWQELGSRLLQYGLYALLLVVPILGLLYSNAHDVVVRPFNLFTLPALIEPTSREVARVWRGYHDIGSKLILFAVGLHAAAALFHHFIRRDTVLLSMMTSDPAARRRR